MIRLVSQPVLDFMVWAKAKSKSMMDKCLEASGSSKEECLVLPSPPTTNPKSKGPHLHSHPDPLTPQQRHQFEVAKGLMEWLGPSFRGPSFRGPSFRPLSRVYLEVFFALLADLMVLNGWLDFSYAKTHGQIIPSPNEPQSLAKQKPLVKALWPAYKHLRSHLDGLKSLDRKKGPRPETHCNRDAFLASRFYRIIRDHDLLRPPPSYHGEAKDRVEGLWCDVFQDVMALDLTLLGEWPSLRDGALDSSRLRFFFSRMVDRIGYGWALARLDGEDHALTRRLLEALYKDAFEPLGKTSLSKTRPTPIHDPLDGFVQACKGQAKDLIRTYLGLPAVEALRPFENPSSKDARLWSESFVTLWQAMALSRKEGEMIPPEVVGAWAEGELDDWKDREEIAKEVEDFGIFLGETAWLWELGSWWQVLTETTYYDTIQALALLYTAGLMVDPSLAPTLRNQGLLACVSPLELSKLLGRHADTPESIGTTLDLLYRWTHRVGLPVLQNLEGGKAGRRFTLDPVLDALTLHYAVLETPLPPSLTTKEWSQAKASLLSMVIGKGTCGVKGLDLWTLVGHPTGTRWFQETGGDVETLGASILTCYLLTPPIVQELFMANPQARGHYKGFVDRHCIPMVQVLFAGAVANLLKDHHPIDLERLRTMTQALFSPIDHGIGGSDRVIPTQAIFRGLEVIPPAELVKALASDPSSFREFILRVASSPQVTSGSCWDAKGPKPS